MKGLVAKEIRMLFPVFIAALALAVLPVWLMPESFTDENLGRLVIPLFCFGTLLMALTSFGREFSMGTFPLLLSLPVTRGRVWRAKISVLCVAMLVVFVAGCLSVFIWYNVHHPARIWVEGKKLDAPYAAAIVFTTFLVVIASGLWTTLLLRQTVAAFWIALLVPLAIMTGILWENGAVSTVEWALVIYAVAGFWWARRMFYRAEEVGWTGGEVSLPELRSARVAAPATGRKHRPMAALLGKELRLYREALAGMAGLFVIHLGTIALRKTLHGLPEYSNWTLFAGFLEMFGGFWILVPVVTGGLSVADERRMGTFDGNLCLPVSRRMQFVTKFLVSFLISGGLSVLLLWTAEGIASQFHAAASFGGGNSVLDAKGLRVLSFIILALALALFYASTLARNILQAIVTAAGTLFALCLAFALLEVFRRETRLYWESPLWPIFFWLAVVTMGMRLAYMNFWGVSETRRMWLRNARGLGGAVIVATVLAGLVVHRAWEYLTPIEPPHGHAQLSLAQSPRLQFDLHNISVLFPDGPLWWKQVIYDPPRFWEPFGQDLPIPLGNAQWLSRDGNHFLDGTNWVAEAHNSVEDVAVRDDGTLWVSEKLVQRVIRKHGELIWQPAAPVVRYGEENDWKSVARSGEYSMILLKEDGTMWRWGTNMVNHTLGLANEKPVRLATGEHWDRTVGTQMGVFAWKDDGLAYMLTDPSLVVSAKPDAQKAVDTRLVQVRWPRFDHLKIRSVATLWWYELAVVEDGTLWRFGQSPAGRAGAWEVGGGRPTQVGTESDWVAVAGNHETMLALKADGTLWKWENQAQWWYENGEPFTGPPTRVGTHSDWVAVGGTSSGVCALSADGGVWLWYLQMMHVWLEPSRKPVMLGNIFVGK